MAFSAIDEYLQLRMLKILELLVKMNIIGEIAPYSIIPEYFLH